MRPLTRCFQSTSVIPKVRLGGQSRASFQTVAENRAAVTTSPQLPAARPISVPRLYAEQINAADDINHVSAVHQHLEETGLLQMSLAFEDDNCHYLERLIRNLHRHHGHGLPIDHSASRRWFWDVRPNPSHQASHGPQARSETFQVFPWHTDCSYESAPPRFFALQVLHADHCGGGVLSLLPVGGLLRHLSESSQQTLSMAEYQIKVPPEFIKDQDLRHITGKVMSMSNTKECQVRFREDIITPVTDGAAAAVEELKSLLLGSEIENEVLRLSPQVLPRGSIVLVDNRRWLHARSEVKDPRRHLRRVRWDARPFE